MEKLRARWPRLEAGTGPDKLFDVLGAAAAVVGVVLVASGVALQESSAAVGGAVRVLGGVLLLSGLGTLLLGKPHRRRAVIRASRLAATLYRARTARWRRTDRVGLAAAAIGLILLAPALVLQILFGTIFGTIVIVPGIVLFWGGVALLLYKRLWVLLFGKTRGNRRR